MAFESKLNREEIAKRIKAARKNAGITQLEVAKALNLTPQAISNYERGLNNVPTSILFKLASLYDVDYLSFIDSLPEPYSTVKATIHPAQYEQLEYEAMLYHDLSYAREFERLDIIEQRLKQISPNELELLIAKKVDNGTKAEQDLARLILESLPLNKKSIRIGKIIYLLQAYEKVKRGEEFPINAEQDAMFDI